MNDKELKEQLKKEILNLCETNSSVMTYMECLMRKYEYLQSKIDKANELLEELEHNQNINLEKGLENRVDIDYVIERLNDCIGER